MSMPHSWAGIFWAWLDEADLSPCNSMRLSGRTASVAPGRRGNKFTWPISRERAGVHRSWENRAAGVLSFSSNAPGGCWLLTVPGRRLRCRRPLDWTHGCAVQANYRQAGEMWLDRLLHQCLHRFERSFQDASLPRSVPRAPISGLISLRTGIAPRSFQPAA